MMSVTVSSSISGFEWAEPEHIGDQRLDEFALLEKVQLDFGFGQQVLDPPGELGLEDSARHLRGGGNVHMFEDERLDWGLCRLDRRAVGAPRIPIVGTCLGILGFEKPL